MEKRMKVVARTDEYTIYQRRDERYAVKDADKQAVNGRAKVEILLKHELIVATLPQDEPEEAPAEEAAEAEETVEATADEGSEESEAPAPADEADAGDSEEETKEDD